ncbi:MAG: DoxX family membrane protein [Deltaproteobacteria bacterium]|nr:DoxX family membrane protein [Deltaproteobacteria bacterium]
MRAFLLWRGHAVVALPLRLYLGMIFIYASMHKIANPGVFALDIATYDLLPLTLVNPMAIIMPYLEFVVGMQFIVAWRTRAAGLLITGMMAIFVIAVSVALAKGLDTSCGCFASQAMEEDPINGLTILRDVAWLLMGTYVTLFDRRPLGLDGLLMRRRKSNER